MYEPEDENYDTYYIRLYDTDISEAEDILWRYPKGYLEEDVVFYWTEGNGACDCNRALEFYNSRGIRTMSRPCGTTRIALLGIWRRDGLQIADSEVG